MKVIRIIVQIGILNIFYYIGVGIVSLLHLPFPASIVGLLLLALSLQFKIIKVEYIQDGAGFLIGVLTLFFIPATVGVIDYPQLWTSTGLLVMLAVAVSTLIVIYVTGSISQVIERKEVAKKETALDKTKGGVTVE
ncbi:CidA/LrgA family protein [Lysinibacillus sp. NPDC097287]|uniref:CidA/LrgA family protein n=1 Tax=Lysinibacillus sp. NPDC097287 TaxID=3364144 RepID=UPI0038137D9D